MPDLQSGVIKLAAGSHHTCALLASGEVSCWGRNNYGQLGSGLQKFELEGGSGDTVYGFDSGGAATWSIEEPRRVAHPTDPPPASLSDITDIYAGPTYSCALNASNELYCWGALVGGSSCTGNASTCPYFPDPSGAGGYAVAQVELDNDDEYVVDNLHAERAAVVPLRVGAGFDIQAAGAGSRHLCLVVDEADTSLTNIYCLGHNDKGQLGDGSTNSWRTPTELAPDVDGNIVRALAIVGADSHTCALVDNNNAKCWGSNENGQIGNSDLQREQSYQPFDVKLNSSQ